MNEYHLSVTTASSAVPSSTPCTTVATPKRDTEARRLQIAWLKLAAEKDPKNSHVLHALGICYEDMGDAEEARKYYIKATAEEQYQMGIKYEDEKNLSTSVEHYRRAAELGHADALNILGGYFEQGTGVARDPTEAVKLYKQAASKRNVYALYNLGRCFEVGIGVTQNLTEAAKQYKHAAELGYTKALQKLFELGYCYEEGDGVVKDPAKAAELYRQAADLGHSVALNHLGCCFELGIGVARDPAEAAKLYKQAADKGDIHASYNLGRYYAANPREGNAEPYHYKAADQGHPRAQLFLATRYSKGSKIVPREITIAIEFYRKAAGQNRDDLAKTEAQNALHRLGIFADTSIPSAAAAMVIPAVKQEAKDHPVEDLSNSKSSTCCLM
jgi:TPR repeat protein